ncbi:MAG: dihydrolipoyl dehydrogenase [Puniceicoccaceae bacterium]
MASNTTETDLVVLGAGPGGYAAAFYAAERGLDVALVESERALGGVCLKRGCIPSKAYLHATRQIEEARASGERGITFDEPRIDCQAMRKWKDGVVERLSGGIAGLAKKRKVKVVHGRGYFQDSETLRIETEDGQDYLKFNRAIIATGSRPVVPGVFDLGSSRVLTSKEALELDEVPERLLIIGGGYIGLELGTVYARLGAKVTLAEALDNLMPGTDPDLVAIVHDKVAELFQDIYLNTKVADLSTSGESLKAVFSRKTEDDDEATEEAFFDKVLVAIGRRPNSENLGLENTSVEIDDKGFITADNSGRTADSNIHAIGDVAGGEMLAHKATREAHITVDAICGDRLVNEPLLVPAVVFTEPAMAWVGMSEKAAKEACDSVRIARFDWRASGRALSVGAPRGLTKMIIDGDTERILGVFMVGHGAGELIAEATLAIEMAATVRDLAETIHAHPTFSETLKECAESFFGISPHSL